VFQWNSQLCTLVGKQRSEKYILSLSLELVKMGSYDFSHPCDDPQNSQVFFKLSLVDTEFDMFRLAYLHFIC
jgi:hypothetical protein